MIFVTVTVEKNLKNVVYKQSRWGKLFNIIHLRTRDSQAFVEKIIKSISALPFREEEARIHAELLSSLLNKGNHIGAHDLIIAATAITNNCAVLTKNEFDFNRIPGLEVISIPTLEKA